MRGGRSEGSKAVSIKDLRLQPGERGSLGLGTAKVIEAFNSQPEGLGTTTDSRVVPTELPGDVVARNALRRPNGQVRSPQAPTQCQVARGA